MQIWDPLSKTATQELIGVIQKYSLMIIIIVIITLMY